MPIKLFLDGDVLTANEINTYLMDQAVCVFANSGARDAAFSDIDPSKPSRGSGGRLCYLVDTSTVQYWDGSQWVDSDQFTVADNYITNAKINSSAAIAYTKLNLSNGIVNADINSSASIADSKLATISTAGKVSNSATTATSANTNSAIVARDSSGNFSAGSISLSGSVSVVGTVVSHTVPESSSTSSLTNSLDGKIVELSQTSVNLATTGGSWTNGTQFTIIAGTGATTIVNSSYGDGTRFRASPLNGNNVKLRAQWSSATFIYKQSENVWYVIGDLTST